MEKIKEILNSLKERVVNPFFISFIIAWLWINWKVTITLIWYDIEQIHKIGYKTVYDLFNQNSNYIEPFLIALGYTIGAPMVRNLYNAFMAFTLKWGEDIFLYFSKGSSIPTEKFLTLRDEIGKRTEILNNLILDEEKKREEGPIYHYNQDHFIPISPKE